MKKGFGIGRVARKLVYRLIDVGIRLLAKLLRPDGGYVSISRILLSDGTAAVSLTYKNQGNWVGFFDSDATGFTVQTGGKDDA